jgi:hypothetical protein
MGIRIAVLSFCLKALISRDFGLLRCLLLGSVKDFSHFGLQPLA